ncbi:MAG: hypothetical protein II517_06295, partial [Ruminococcus sp.]|nr:hypothetical protein [Ruminococcus sp.]
QTVSDARYKTREFAASSRIDQVDLVNLAENVGTDESKKLADYVVDIKNSKTAIFSMDNLTQTIREGYDCVMRCKDDLLRIFG